MGMKDSILLESGTNELEVVEFGVGHNEFGINVIKVREIINHPEVITKIPHAHPYVEGVIQLRGEVLPVIDLAKVLGLQSSEIGEGDKFIVAEFNQAKTIFRVHWVSQIHRISWDEIERPSELYGGMETNVNGVVKMDEKMILLLDFEKILTEVHPDSALNKKGIDKERKSERSNKSIYIAEDSAMLRKLINETLMDAGYQRLRFFHDGKSALAKLMEIKNSDEVSLQEEVQLMITDIEMPQMDGHHLTRQIKQDEVLSGLPVIIFSSLITNDLRHKGEAVGADRQVSKPDIATLVDHLDELLL